VISDIKDPKIRIGVKLNVILAALVADVAV